MQTLLSYGMVLFSIRACRPGGEDPLPAAFQQHTRYYTDEWEAYTTILPQATHHPSAKGSGQTSSVEAINCSLRQRCGVLVRKSCSCSKCLTMHRLRFQYGIEAHNRRFTTI